MACSILPFVQSSAGAEGWTWCQLWVASSWNRWRSLAGTIQGILNAVPTVVSTGMSNKISTPKRKGFTRKSKQATFKHMLICKVWNFALFGMPAINLVSCTHHCSGFSVSLLFEQAVCAHCGVSEALIGRYMKSRHSLFFPLTSHARLLVTAFVAPEHMVLEQLLWWWALHRSCFESPHACAKLNLRLQNYGHWSCAEIMHEWRVYTKTRVLSFSPVLYLAWNECSGDYRIE